MMRQSLKLNRQQNTGYVDTGEFIFAFVYFIYIIRAILDKSTIAEFIPTTGKVTVAVRLLLIACVCTRIIWLERYTVTAFIKIVFLMAIFGFSMLKSDYTLMVDVFLLIVGAKGIELKRLIKLYYVTAAILLVLLIGLSLMGVIENYAFEAQGRGVRYGFGINYATDFAALVLYIQVAGGYVRKEKYHWYNMVFWLVIAALILKYCDARLDCILIAAHAVAMYIFTRKQGVLKTAIVKYGMIFSFPLLAAISIFIHYIYDGKTAWLLSLDELLSGRLRLGRQAITDYGFSLFGQNIKMQGNAWTMEAYDPELGYYFVDCGYLHVALRYGTLVLLVLIIGYAIVMKRAADKSDYMLVLALFFIAVSSVVDHHILQLAYNCFVLALAGMLTDLPRGIRFKYVRKKEISKA